MHGKLFCPKHVLLLGAALVCGAWSHAAHAQMPGRGSTDGAPGRTTGLPQIPSDPRPQWPGQPTSPMHPDETRPDSDPAHDRMEAARLRGLKDDRQKRLESDADKLLALATELKADVDNTSNDQLSVVVVKKAAEMEKLAHDIKERERN